MELRSTAAAAQLRAEKLDVELSTISSEDARKATNGEHGANELNLAKVRRVTCHDDSNSTQRAVTVTHASYETCLVSPQNPQSLNCEHTKHAVTYSACGTLMVTADVGLHSIALVVLNVWKNS